MTENQTPVRLGYETTLENLRYDDIGQGLPVVLLHAFPLNRQMWKPQWSLSSDQFRFLLPDLPGFGASPSLLGDPSLERYAETIVNLLDKLGLPQVVLGGLSMGGYITFQFLRKYPQRVIGLILADTRATPDTPKAREERRKMMDLIQQEGLSPLADRLIPRLLGKTSQQEKPEVAQQVREWILANSTEGILFALQGMMERGDSSDLLPQIQVPTLVLVGEEDELTPPEEVEKMAKRIPNAHLVSIPKAGHLSNLEVPEVFNKALREYLLSFKS